MIKLNKNNKNKDQIYIKIKKQIEIHRLLQNLKD